jgi:hypothetical protein
MRPQIRRETAPSWGEGQQNAVTTLGRVVGVRAVQQPVVEHDSIARPHRDGHLSGLIADRRMIERKSSSVLVSVAQRAMQRQAAMVRAWQHPQSACDRRRVAQVTQQGDLRHRWAHAHGMIPTPPVLMPPERRAMGVLGGHVARDPAQICCSDPLSQGLIPLSIVEDDPNNSIVPAKRGKSIVRPLASRHRRRPQRDIHLIAQRIDTRLIEKPIKHRVANRAELLRSSSLPAFAEVCSHTRRAPAARPRPPPGSGRGRSCPAA